ncbi:MAG: 50S ribosomal protein L10 [Candidatus Diapherotrites archaeon]|nr:50S ribosomal protein L10 [Candidatus Diapherotrites archaeon]
MVRSHTRKWKENELKELEKLMAGAKVIAVAEISRFPSNLFSEIRKKLAGKATIRVTKTRVALKALGASKFKGLGIEKSLQRSVALIFTDMDPFELYLLVKSCKGSAAVKPGMVAEADIIVPAGDTGLPPGPDLADLKNAGLKVKLQGASIKISEDSPVAKKGEVITDVAARALIKLGIKPLEIGLKITAALEGKQLYEGTVLNIDLDETVKNIMSAYNNALNLSVNIEYPTKANIEILIGKGYREAKGVALEAKYACKATEGELKAEPAAEAGTGEKKEEAPKQEGA